MPRIKVIKPGLMTTIQDEGRKSMAYYAIPKSGYMHPSKAELANFLVGNSKYSAVLECTIIPPHLEFLDDNYFAITGDNFEFKLNGSIVSQNKTIFVKRGDILKGAAQKDSYLGYIAFQGKIVGQEHYGSISTYTNAALGGLQGMPIIKDDIITIVNQNIIPVNRRITESLKPNKKVQLIFKKGPEFKFLDEKSKEVLFNSEYKISSSSNRMGARLYGARLNTSKNHLNHSVPVLPGIIQLPPSGQPIIVLVDGQTTGGYPRIGFIDDDEIEKVIGIGKIITFKKK